MAIDGWIDLKSEPHTQTQRETVLIHEKEGNHAIYNNMEEPQGHYAEWNKSDGERQILYDLSHM